MYTILTHILFWLYWAIVIAIGALLIREVVRSHDWKLQAAAALAVIPFLLRGFLIK